MKDPKDYCSETLIREHVTPPQPLPDFKIGAWAVKGTASSPPASSWVLICSNTLGGALDALGDPLCDACTHICRLLCIVCRTIRVMMVKDIEVTVMTLALTRTHAVKHHGGCRFRSPEVSHVMCEEFKIQRHTICSWAPPWPKISH